MYMTGPDRSSPFPPLLSPSHEREEEGHQPSSIRPRFLAENRGLQGVVQGCSMRQPWEQVRRAQSSL